MNSYFDLALPRDQVLAISSLGLAHLGDAVYELLVRSWLCVHGKSKAQNLHKETVSRVRAGAQAQALETIMPMLTEEEITVCHRGRNAHVGRIPKNASRSEYMHATALEALMGYLYLRGEKGRIEELFAAIMKEDPYAG